MRSSISDDAKAFSISMIASMKKSIGLLDEALEDYIFTLSQLEVSDKTMAMILT